MCLVSKVRVKGNETLFIFRSTSVYKLQTMITVLDISSTSVIVSDQKLDHLADF